ncbi:MAG: putative quinol monooxygenase [Planctomycetota bacterium]
MQNNVYTIAVLPAKAAAADALLAELRTLADATRQEAGCIEYGFYREAADSNTVLSFERWVDQDAEDAHWQTPHLKHALGAMQTLLETEPQVFKCKKTI